MANEHSAEHSDANQHGDDGAHDHGGTGKYWLVFLALCILTSASFFTVSDYWPFKDTPSIGWAFMMAVSCTKAMLVILVFMHLFWEANWKYVLTIPAALMSVFLVLMLIPDIGLRQRTFSEEHKMFAAEKEPDHMENDAHGSHGGHSHDAGHSHADGGHAHEDGQGHENHTGHENADGHSQNENADGGKELDAKHEADSHEEDATHEAAAGR